MYPQSSERSYPMNTKPTVYLHLGTDGNNHQIRTSERGTGLLLHEDACSKSASRPFVLSDYPVRVVY